MSDGPEAIPVPGPVPAPGPDDGPLEGGNMNDVRREGDTVVRRAGPWTPTVHRYLRHVRAAGVDWVPEPLGVEGDRERLGFVAGVVPVYPLPDWVWSDEVLVEGARRLRQLHDASIGLDLDDAVWQAPTRLPAEVICHNDFAPHNLVFDDGRVVGAIDVDRCAPGPRLWDLAYYATRVVPLTAETPPGAPGMEQARARVEALVAAYEDGPVDHARPSGASITWEDVLRVAVLRLHDLAAFSRRMAVELDKPELREHAAGYDVDARSLDGVRRGS